MSPIPNNMTNAFQPLDRSPNQSCKFPLRKKAQSWYSSQIEKEVKEGKQNHEVKVDTRIIVVEPMHAYCVVSFYDHMLSHAETVTSGGVNPESIKLMNGKQA